MSLNVWIDIDNPPQARYLLPLVRRFEQAGHDVLLTARAYGDTFAILEGEGATFEPIGSSFGKGAPRKLYGLARRARQLVGFLDRRRTRPNLVVTGSRSATLAARKLALPSFVIVDYEYVNLFVYRLARSHILHPRVIDGALFERRGIATERLISFEGLKEDIAFADVDFSAVAPHEFSGSNPMAVRVLFRPPAEESHYYRSESRDLAVEFLRYLASEGAKIVFSPRSSAQVGYLDFVPSWKEEPVILTEPIPFVALLKGVDAVVSAGGTMLREAAYLGVPAYSIFRSTIGSVDGYLASIDRLSIFTSPGDFSSMKLKQNRSIAPLRKRSNVADEVIQMIIDRTKRRSDGYARTRLRRLRARVGSF